MRPRNGMKPIHPGEILREEFLRPLDMEDRARDRAAKAVLSGCRSSVGIGVLPVVRHPPSDALVAASTRSR